MADGFELKDLPYVRLFDVYAPLLTAHQREVAELYFNYDLSLGEIAEQKGVSRQSVSDCLGKIRKQLEEYEKKLAFSSSLQKRAAEEECRAAFISEWAAEVRASHPELSEALDRLKETVLKKREGRKDRD